MMSNREQRERFVARVTGEGLPYHVAQLLMRHGATLHRLAELECSSEAADRDRVQCPGVYSPKDCICEHWSYADGGRGCGCEIHTGHHPVTRIAVKEQKTTQRVKAILAPYPKLVPVFNGDPRGAVLRLQAPHADTCAMPTRHVCTCDSERHDIAVP